LSQSIAWHWSLVVVEGRKDEEEMKMGSVR